MDSTHEIETPDKNSSPLPNVASVDDATIVRRTTNSSMPPATGNASSSDEDSEATIISCKNVAPPSESTRNLSAEFNARTNAPTNKRAVSSVVAAAQVLLGKSLDHFELLELVGGGGMGAVFRAHDRKLDRIVAVKVIPNAGQDQDMAKRFKFEAQSAAKLDHLHIARVYYVGEVEDWSYIVFEYVNGVNLRDLVVSNGPLSIDEAIWFTRQVAESLMHASARFVVHRDIKPSNILVTNKGLVKLVDMGLARTTAVERTANELTASNITLGTFDYISPEQARDPRSADVRSDLYSLGCTLYFLLCGKPPFPDGTAIQKLMMHGNVQPKDIREYRSDIPDELAAIIAKLMAKNPNYRYQQPVALINDLYLLAEFENLPKSRQAGTVAVSPTIEERSVFESMLPWMVALGLLLAATLWMQNVHRDKSLIRLPRERVAFAVQQTSNAVSKDQRELGGSSQSPIPSTAHSDLLEFGSSPANTLDTAIASPSHQPISPEDSYNDNVIDDLQVSNSIASATPIGVERNIAKSPLASKSAVASPGPAATASGDSLLPNENSFDSLRTGNSPTAGSVASRLSSNNFEAPMNVLPNSLNARLPQARFTDRNLSFDRPLSSEPMNNNLPSSNPNTTSSQRHPIVIVDEALVQKNSSDLMVARTLQEALSIASSKPEFDEIVLMHPVRIDRKLVWEHPSITLRSGTLQHARIEIASMGDSMPQFQSSDEEELIYGFEVGIQSLRLVDVDIVITSPEMSSGIAAGFALRPGAALQLDRCAITIMPSISGWRPCAFASLPRKTSSTVSANKDFGTYSPTGELYVRDYLGSAESKPIEQSTDPIQIRLTDSIIRGNGDFLIEAKAIRTDLRWENGLLAIDGRMIDYGGAKSANRLPLNLRFALKNVTAAMQRGFSRLRYNDATDFPVCLSCNSENCAYVIDADAAMFEFDGVPALAGLQISEPDQAVWMNWLDVRGSENAYDANVREMIRLRVQGKITARFEFEMAIRTLLTERSPEASIRWLSSLNRSSLTYLQSPNAYRQRPGAFQPGMVLARLPILNLEENSSATPNQ